MPAFSLEDYEPVADRIERFWKDHPEVVIETDLVHFDDKHFIVKTTVRITCDPDHLPAATGYAEEIIGSSNVNRTSALENCETSSIGRALANLGYAVKNRASREEMEKVQSAPRPRSGMKRTPTPESPESHKTAPGNGVTLEVATAVAKMKTELLNRTGGDKGEASRLWTGTLESFGLTADQPIPADMVGPIRHAVEALAIKGEE